MSENNSRKAAVIGLSQGPTKRRIAQADLQFQEHLDWLRLKTCEKKGSTPSYLSGTAIWAVYGNAQQTPNRHQSWRVSVLTHFLDINGVLTMITKSELVGVLETMQAYIFWLALLRRCSILRR